MAQSWRDYRHANSANSAIRSENEAEPAPIGTNGTNGTEVPASLLDSLKRLEEMAAPRLLKPEVWPEVVKDALRLSSDGWAVKALGLGWSELDLFGAVTEARGDPFGDGLAAWLEGRKLLALTADKAIACDPNGTRHYFLLPRGKGARLLWDLGGGR